SRPSCRPERDAASPGCISRALVPSDREPARQRAASLWGMSTPPNQRSIKISDDERGGWSSDRPRPGGGPPRKPDVSTRCRVLTPTDVLRYSPGSLLIVASASTRDRDAFVERLIETKSAVLSIEKVRGLLAGRVAE